MPKLKTLRTCKLFERLSYRDLAILAPHIQEESAKKDQWIIKEGSSSSGLIIIRSGKAELTSGLTGSNSIVAGPGDFFGELSFVQGGVHRAVGAKCQDSCEFLRLEASAYQKLLSEAPEVAGRVAESILGTMTEKVTQAMEVFKEVLGGRKEMV